MVLFIRIAYLFALGSSLGWAVELFYRRFFDPDNLERKWINPGFLAGPYLPLYGFCTWLLYGMRRTEEFIPIVNDRLRMTVLFLIMTATITALEFVTGMIFIVKLKIMLWDYRCYRWNYRGIVCPRFTLYWLLLCVFYSGFVDPALDNSATYIVTHMETSFFVGLFYGTFFIDLLFAIKNMVNISDFAKKNDLVVSVYELRATINILRERNKEEPLFFLPMHFSDTLNATLEQYKKFRDNNIFKKLFGKKDESPEDDPVRKE